MTVRSAASASSSTPSSPRISPITRLRHARHVHAQLQERKWTDRSSSAGPAVHEATGRQRAAVAQQDFEAGAPHWRSHRPDPQTQQKQRRVPPASDDALANDLERMWHKQQADGDLSRNALVRRVEQIGAEEKDALVLHLLQQTAFLQAQRNDVVAVGEKLTTQLVQQQHELRVQFKAQTTRLREQLQQALHHHPEVTRLEDKIAQLQEANRECEQKLLFAVQKLHRSRQRERELRLEHESDPLLWGL